MITTTTITIAASALAQPHQGTERLVVAGLYAGTVLFAIRLSAPVGPMVVLKNVMMVIPTIKMRVPQTAGYPFVGMAEKKAEKNVTMEMTSTMMAAQMTA